MPNTNTADLAQHSCASCAIRPIALCGAANDDQTEWLQAHRIGLREVRARRTIFREGDTPDEIYVLLRGWACRYKEVSGDRRQILSFLLPGNLTVPQALFPRPLRFSVKAVTDALLCRFRIADIHELIATRPELGKQILTLFFRQSGVLDERLADLGRRNAEERILHLLLHLHRRQSKRASVDAGEGCDFPLRQDHIADALGLTTVHVSRVIMGLRAKGLVVLERGRLILPDQSAVQAIVANV